MLAGPALAGLLLASGGAGLVFATMAAVGGGSALLVHRIAGPPPAGRGAEEAAAGAVGEVVAGFRTLARHPEPRLLVGCWARSSW